MDAASSAAAGSASAANGKAFDGIRPPSKDGDAAPEISSVPEPLAPAAPEASPLPFPRQHRRLSPL